MSEDKKQTETDLEYKIIHKNILHSTTDIYIILSEIQGDSNMKNCLP